MQREEALALASCKPNVVLLDVNLPDMGFEVCKQLKANPQTKDIPVIQISATYGSDAAVSGFVLRC
jgi:CheY-like chemotaxis protein